MNNIFEAKLTMPPGAVAPDIFYCQNYGMPEDTFIISRDRQGKAKSHFGEFVWDFSAYHPEGKVESLYFTFWGKNSPTERQLELSLEMRYIIFCLIWHRNGSPLSSGTLRNYISTLSAIANYADENEITLKNIFLREKQITDFVVTRCSGWMIETLCSLLPILAKLGKDVVGFEVVSTQVINHLKKFNHAYREGLKQHPPLPTRIYTNLISGLVKELEEWKKFSKDILDAAKYCAQDPRAGRVPRAQRGISLRLKIYQQKFEEFKEIISVEAQGYILRQGLKIELSSLSLLIGQAQYNAKVLIQIFSGMRDDEANTLPYNCLGSSKSRGTTHFLIKGRTTKFSHGLALRAQWVTNREGHEAIKVAQEVAQSIYSIFKTTPEQSPGRINKHPLFISLRYFGFRTKKILPIDDHYLVCVTHHRELPSACISTINEEDILELEHIDPHRAWRSEDKFKLGANWVFTSHQTRRSLALYAQRSGLVSLPSLRRQLKHITDQMSQYYAKGSEFAKNFIGDDKRHFGLDWQNTQAESSGLSYILNVLTSSKELFGAHANWLEQRFKKPEKEIFLNREITMRKFKKGELSYKETILGGCMNQGQCDRVAVRWLHTACVTDNCKNLIGDLSKLELVINAQENLIKSLSINSFEFHTESYDLACLKLAHSNIKDNKGIKF